MAHSDSEVDASPVKAFFIENLTRDLTLEDAILDLVDNSIDSAIQTMGFDVSADLLRLPPRPAASKTNVEIEVTETRIAVSDSAGGIDPARAKSEVFRLGRPRVVSGTRLGVYGIGLKRAVFKMGRRITITSRHVDGAFCVRITPEWLEAESNWRLPLEPVADNGKTGTEIVIEDLRPEIQSRVRDPALLTRLRDSLGRTYGLFLDELVSVHLNGLAIPGHAIPLGQSEQIVPAKKEFEERGVTVEIMAGLAARGARGEWEMESAGWYVVCNGRIVVFADKTDLTGWGVEGPKYQPKYRGFIGVAFFFSSDPSLLPWTTTKRGLNRESSVFQMARRRMTEAAGPVLRFLNQMYPSDAVEEITERRLADKMTTAPLHQVASSADRIFEVSRSATRQRPAKVNVQFKALRSDIDRAKSCLSRPSWGAGKVGEYALKYFLEQECPE